MLFYYYTIINMVFEFDLRNKNRGKVNQFYNYDDVFHLGLDSSILGVLGRV